MTIMLCEITTGTPIAIVEVKKKDDIQLLDDRFELHEVKEVEVEDTVRFGE